MLEKRVSRLPGDRQYRPRRHPITLAFVARHAACAPATLRPVLGAGPPRTSIFAGATRPRTRCRPDAQVSVIAGKRAGATQ